MSYSTPSYSLKIKDAEGVTQNLAADIDSKGYVPFHSILGTVEVSSSLVNPTGITGSVTVNNFPEVQTVTASLDSRLGVTGSVTVNNFPEVQTVTASLNNRLGVTGSVTVNNFPVVQTVTASFDNRLAVTGNIEINNFPAVQAVTASLSNRLGVTGNILVDNFPSVQTVTSSNENSIFEQKAYGNYIDEVVKTTYTWNTNASGTFMLADKNNSRRELMIHNTGPGLLYVKMSSTAQNDSTKHGFTLINTSSAPVTYNFIVYPSGTYLSSDASRVFYHSGYFISSSVTGTVIATNITYN